jgi:NADH:ubiquinone oxidoreductase subunit K
MGFEGNAAGSVVIAAIALFWVGMLGLLWRRSLLGMLVGLLFAWVSVAMAAIGFSRMRAVAVSGESGVNVFDETSGGVLVLCVAVLGCLQIAVGLSIVVARIKRSGTLDADDAGLLEG